MSLNSDAAQKFSANLSASTRTGLLELPMVTEAGGTVYCRAYIIDEDNNVYYGDLQQFEVGSVVTDAVGELILADEIMESAIEQEDVPAAEEEPERSRSGEHTA